MTVYMEITRDKYELPLAVANNLPELARMVGAKESTVKSHISHKTGKYIRVEINEEE